MSIALGMTVTLPDARKGRIVALTWTDREWRAEVRVQDDPDVYVIESAGTGMWLEHVIEERGVCTHCDLWAALNELDLKEGMT